MPENKRKQGMIAMYNHLAFIHLFEQEFAKDPKLTPNGLRATLWNAHKERIAKAKAAHAANQKGGK
jgi:hypothetical protein